MEDALKKKWGNFEKVSGEIFRGFSKEILRTISEEIFGKFPDKNPEINFGNFRKRIAGEFSGKISIELT